VGRVEMVVAVMAAVLAVVREGEVAVEGARVVEKGGAAREEGAREEEREEEKGEGGGRGGRR
jgi:hypothetical protein